MEMYAYLDEIIASVHRDVRYKIIAFISNLDHLQIYLEAFDLGL